MSNKIENMKFEGLQESQYYANAMFTGEVEKWDHAAKEKKKEPRKIKPYTSDMDLARSLVPGATYNLVCGVKISDRQDKDGFHYLSDYLYSVEQVSLSEGIQPAPQQQAATQQQPATDAYAQVDNDLPF